jgi:hypothetical protein
MGSQRAEVPLDRRAVVDEELAHRGIELLPCRESVQPMNVERQLLGRLLETLPRLLEVRRPATVVLPGASSKV